MVMLIVHLVVLVLALIAFVVMDRGNIGMCLVFLDVMLARYIPLHAEQKTNDTV